MTQKPMSVDYRRDIDMEDALDPRQNGLPLLPASLCDVLCNVFFSDESTDTGSLP